MNAIYLDANMVPATLRRGYDGKKFKAHVCEQMTIPMTAGLWDGGSRDKYSVIRLVDGAEISPISHNAAPWNSERRDVTVQLEPGIAVVEHSMFCGKDMGLTFYVHPSNAAALLPAPSGELTPHEKPVLIATRSFKSSYAGRDRYDMMRDDYRCARTVQGDASYPSREQWEAAKTSLIGKGLLNKAGAITVAGRNACPSR